MTINNDIVQVTNDAQASIDRLSNSWSAAGIAVGKFVAEATPAVPLLERIARGIDGARSYFSGEDKKKGEPEKPRADEPAGPKSRFPGRMQSYEHARATREALTARRPKLSDFSGRFQSRDHARALEQWEREQRAFRTEHGAASPRKPDYSPVTSFKPRRSGTVRPALPIRATIRRCRLWLRPLPKRQCSGSAGSSRARAPRPSPTPNRQRSRSGRCGIFPCRRRSRHGSAGRPEHRPAPPLRPQHLRRQRRPQPASAPLPAAVQIVNNITVNGAGKNGRQIGSEIARELAKLGNSSSSLFDTV